MPPDERQSIAIRPDLHLRLKKRAVGEGKTLQDLSEELLAFGLSNKKIDQTKKTK